MALFDDPEMQEIFEGFLVETNELLESITIDIVEVEKNPQDLELINKLFRSFHTIKGTASFMGFSDISGITHHAEDILNKLRKSELNITQPIIDVLLEVQDWIVVLLERVQNGINSSVDYSATISKIDVLKVGGDYSDAGSNSSTTDKEDYMVDDSSSGNNVYSEESRPRAVDVVFATPELGEGADNWTDDELKLIDAAFLDVNSDFWIEQDEASASNNNTNNTNNNNNNNNNNNTVITSEENNIIEVGLEEITGDEEVLYESISNAYRSTIQEDFISENNNLDDNVFTLSEEGAIMSIDVASTAESLDVSEEPIVPVSNSPVDTSGSSITNKPTITSKAPNELKQPGKSASDTTIRVDVNRVEAILDLSGELVLNRNRLLQISEYLASDIPFEVLKNSIRDLVETASSINSITSEIQGAAMKMRMVPVARLYQKAPRIVRDLSKESNKKINLIVRGEETEIDRGIIEELNDPLTHMIRNACDHGIETPEVRLALGKPETGTIILDAEQEGNNIVLRITDDGKGMDADFLKQRAVEKGVITVEQAENMSKRDAYQLIFAPGFSTASQVTAVSGRGVGMDVVRTNIAELKGFIEIDTELGKGTTFNIKLPLTLAIIQGLIVSTGEEKFAIPLNSVLNVVSVASHQIYTLNQVEVIRIREDVIPLLRLDYALNTPKKKDNINTSYVVIVGVGSQRIGIIVDSLLGQQEVVIKSLGEYLGAIPAMSGSTIMGDGSVIMIVDVNELVQRVYETHNITKKDMKKILEQRHNLDTERA